MAPNVVTNDDIDGHASYSDGQRNCAYQYMYTVHEVFIVHIHRCNLLLFTHEKCDNIYLKDCIVKTLNFEKNH